MASPRQLVVLSGLPGTGKSTLARQLAHRLPAGLVCVDELEVAMVRSGVKADEASGLAAYAVGEVMAERCLQAGFPAVIDAVNAVEPARRSWREVAVRVGATLHVVEVLCSDAAEHRRRVEGRQPDIPGQRLPTWQDVLARHYEPWSEEERLVVDTRHAASDAVKRIEQYLDSRSRR